MAKKIAKNSNQMGQNVPAEYKIITSRKNILLRSVPLYFLLILLILPACSLGYYFHCYLPKAKENSLSETVDQKDANVKLVRMNGKSLVHPILFVDIESEKFLSPLKRKISQYLEQKNAEGAFTSASVYLKDLNTGFYFNINPDTLYDPASLMKVPLMMIYLKQAETNPGILKKNYVFKGNTANSVKKLITDKSLVAGKNYTVDELLHYMIVYSDNEAFWLLGQNIDNSHLTDLDANLKIPDEYDMTHYPERDKHMIAGVRSIAHYFNVLYNATYLNENMSAYALNLLTKSTFKEGLKKDIEPGMIIAHKFGERTLSYQVNDRLQDLYSEFHEYGIVYFNNRPYLLGVMTRGKESKQLQALVSAISKIVFEEFKAG